jgi:uncharacterized protein YlxW (UPF0749 family)
MSASIIEIALIRERSMISAVFQQCGGSLTMNRKLSIFTLVILALGLLAFYAINRVTAASEQQKGVSDSARDLNVRVGKLEAQVADLQARVKELASKSSSRVLTIPETKIFPRNKMPPGATEHEFNGMKYWSIPLKDDQ